MTTEREVAAGAAENIRPSAGTSAPTPALSRTAVVVGAAVAVLLVAWFFVAWLVLNQNVVDALGESVGSALAILVLVSLFGAFRRNGRRS
jgi:hypothetical protein